MRNPVVLDIAVERCLALLDAFPDLNELQLISREGTAWKQETFAAYAAEFERIRQRFGLPEGIFNLELMSEIVVEDPQSIEMNPRAHPYWTVLPGDDYLATCCGSIRFIEFALDILNDPRLAAALNQRGVQPSLAIYSPNPKTIQLITPGVAAMLPEGMKISYLADYGARDITDGLDDWRPLFNGKRPVQMISWLEFDGCMMLTQGWCHSLDENVKKAHRLGIKSIGFNHWRVRSLEHNAWVAASACFDANKQDRDILHAYCASLYGGHALQLAHDAYAQLEQATLFTKRHTYNIGFTTSWVFHQSTEPPGYSWTYLEQAVQQYTRISALFDELSTVSAGWGRQQALYLRDLCRMSAGHIQAVFHLQNAKLPLVGFKAWPLGNPRAAWPAPELLEVLYAQAEKALRLEEDYMRVYSQWVETCDEQGQLAMHQQGVIEPFRLLAEVIQSHLPRE
ncbi:MAG: hypothetical protein HY835_07030 [Anaerolineae bacterium]|nr:hypothetical protein [Anaerolineae bacterium]